jgi:predicted dehydrogenase
MTRRSTHASTSRFSRRRFLQGSSAALAATAMTAGFPFVRRANAAEDMEIKIGLIGCGGRGTGAVQDALGSVPRVIYPSAGYHTEDVAQGAAIQKKNVKVVALADVFEDKLDYCRVQLAKLDIAIPENRRFVGFDAYKELLGVAEINYVILATPPHFRPMHLKAAVEAGKHVFMEKPGAVDVPGVKMLMEAGRMAAAKGLGIVAGTQRRHQKGYQETIQRIRDGAIGDIVYGRCYWNGGEIWVIERKPGWSDMEWQLRNWNYFTWLSGDHIIEQHVHNLDVMNWVLGAHPQRAVSGLGGRQVRTAEKYGCIFDHFAVEFEYPGGIRVFSQCRQINGCDQKVEEDVVGTRGQSNCSGSIRPKDGPNWRFRGKEPRAYNQEHDDLIASIRAGRPLNEAQTIAESTMTGILGREAVYSGRAVDWDEAMTSTTRLGPEKYEMGPCAVPPVAMPGTYRFL